MKLSCKVVQDLLPMYYDCVCSDESAALIEEHLKDCTECRGILADLHTDIAVAQLPEEDIRPLENIANEWKKSKKRYMKRGICITLAVLLLLTSLLTGIWYLRCARYYYHLTQHMERTPEEAAVYTSSDYAAESKGYYYEVWMPYVWSNSGFARVTADDGLILFLYPEAGGDYSFKLYITDENNQSYTVYLTKDLTADFENHPFPVRSEQEQAQINRLLEQRRGDISAMLGAIQEFWHIDLLVYL